MSRPPYGSHSGCRHACQKRPTSQCGWTRRAAAQTVVAQRVLGGARKALLRDRGNESLRRRLSEGAPPRGAHAGDGFIVGGSCSRADSWLGSALLVAKSGGKEVSHIEKNNDVNEANTRPRYSRVDAQTFDAPPDPNRTAHHPVHLPRARGSGWEAVLAARSLLFSPCRIAARWRWRDARTTRPDAMARLQQLFIRCHAVAMLYGR